MANHNDATSNEEVSNPMHLSLEEMNILSEQLEKEEARLHQKYDNEAHQGEAGIGLSIISELQRKCRDLETNLTEDEKQLISRLLQNELNHIHGHGVRTYEAILSKINQ